MLAASLTLRVQPHKKAEVLSAVDALAGRMRVTAGCARVRVLIDTEDANMLFVDSEWADQAAAEVFFESRTFRIFRGIRILLRDRPLIVLDEVQSRMTRLLPD
jgi:quinol monooxygenase YgiN